MDDPEKKDAALKALRDQHVSATNHLLNVRDRDKLANLLDKEWPGPLPHTVLIAPSGRVVYRKTGGLDARGASARSSATSVVPTPRRRRRHARRSRERRPRCITDSSDHINWQEWDG